MNKKEIREQYGSYKHTPIPPEIMALLLQRQRRKIAKALPLAHKYIRRVGVKGHYKYTYWEPETSSFVRSTEPTSAVHDEIRNSIVESIKRNSKGEFTVQDVEGRMDEQKAGKIAENMVTVLDTYIYTLPGDVYRRALNFVDNYSNKIKENKTLNADLLNKVSVDAIHKLVFQEVESRKRQLGDHGIRHITGNIRYKDMLLDAIEKAGGKKFTNEERIVSDFIMLEHDMGYTSEKSKASFGQMHKIDGSSFFGGESQYLDLFGGHIFLFMRRMVATHDHPEINWEQKPVRSSIRLADNLALFHKEKFPAIFRYVPKGIDYLEEIQAAYLEEDLPRVEEIRGRLNLAIDDTSLDHLLKEDLKKAATEVMIKTGKFTLGMLAGEITGAVYKNGAMYIDIKHRSYEKRLQSLFDMGQQQFKKLADSYRVDLAKGTDNFSFFDRGKLKLQVRVV